MMLNWLEGCEGMDGGDVELGRWRVQMGVVNESQGFLVVGLGCGIGDRKGFLFRGVSLVFVRFPHVRILPALASEIGALINMTEKASVFVIMPFSNDINTVYTGLIRASLEGIGYEVSRADNIESQRNIIRDILEKIDTSDLIIADLTSLNPNVFYELGLAHALRKPVILLTQDIEEVPFDLRSYRLVEYSTHFAEIQDAIDKLKSYGEGFLNGTVPFGNPVTDFLGSTHSIAGSSVRQRLETTISQRSDTAANEATEIIEIENGQAENGDLGFLDHTIALTEGNERLARILEVSGVDLSELTRSIEESASEMQRLSSNSNADTPRALRAVSRRLAEKVNSFAENLKGSNTEYSEILEEMGDSLEFVIAFQMEVQNDSGESSELLYMLPSLQRNAASARESFIDLASQMDSVPRIERRLNQALSNGSREVLAMAIIIDRHIASISRVQQNYG